MVDILTDIDPYGKGLFHLVVDLMIQKEEEAFDQHPSAFQKKY